MFIGAMYFMKRNNIFMIKNNAKSNLFFCFFAALKCPAQEMRGAFSPLPPHRMQSGDVGLWPKHRKKVLPLTRR